MILYGVVGCMVVGVVVVVVVVYGKGRCKQSAARPVASAAQGMRCCAALYCDMEGMNRVFLRTRAAGRSKA